MKSFSYALCLLLMGVGLFSKAQNFAEIKSGKNAKYTWLPEWNNYIAEEIRMEKHIFLNDSILPKEDIQLLCPNYFKATADEKIAFWVLVIAAMAKFESNFNPNSRFKEPAPLNVYSEGLLQLSYVDKANHKDLKLELDSSKNNILDPKINLQSGVKILGKQLLKRKTLFTSKHYYWSVLTNKKAEIIKFFQSNSTKFTFCK
jgi:hypothetical protein